MIWVVVASGSCRLMSYGVCAEAAEGRIRAGDTALIDGDALIQIGDLVLLRRADCYFVTRFIEGLIFDHLYGKVIEVTMRP